MLLSVYMWYRWYKVRTSTKVKRKFTSPAAMSPVAMVTPMRHLSRETIVVPSWSDSLRVTREDYEELRVIDSVSRMGDSYYISLPTRLLFGGYGHIQLANQPSPRAQYEYSLVYFHQREENPHHRTRVQLGDFQFMVKTHNGRLHIQEPIIPGTYVIVLRDLWARDAPVDRHIPNVIVREIVQELPPPPPLEDPMLLLF